MSPARFLTFLSLTSGGNGNSASGLLILLGLTAAGLTLLVAASLWAIFHKADRPGWAVLVPLYNVILLFDLIGRPWWYLAFLFIPGTQPVLWVIVAFGLARSFGRNIPFALGMTVLFPIFLPLLAFGKAQYVGPLGPSYRKSARLKSAGLQLQA
jgi:hypothetical protein